jgi:Peptidase_C39 like family
MKRLIGSLENSASRCSILLAIVCMVVAGLSVASCGSEPMSDPTERVGEESLALASSCYVNSIVFGTWYSQNDPRWSSHLLGNSPNQTIGGYGCVITSLAMAYNDVWKVSTTPDQLNTSAKSAGCFPPGDDNVNLICAVNSRGGPHTVTGIQMPAVATAICSGYPVMVSVTWGSGHKMLVYGYNGGSTTSMSSYQVIDPWDGTSKSLGSYSATAWNELQ